MLRCWAAVAAEDVAAGVQEAAGEGNGGIALQQRKSIHGLLPLLIGGRRSWMLWLLGPRLGLGYVNCADLP
jgi:hypothetical protein